MDEFDIHNKLTELGQKLKQAEKRLVLKSRIPDDHHATAAELNARYQVLLDSVPRDPDPTSKFRRGVADLEHGLKLWIAQLDNEEL
jgi:hypothetical protein